MNEERRPPPRFSEAERRPPIPKKAPAADVAALERETCRLRHLIARKADRFYAIGLGLKRIRDRKLYEAKRYRSLEDYSAQALGLGEGEGARLVAAVETFRRQAALQLGWRRVEAALVAIEKLDSAPGKRDVE